MPPKTFTVGHLRETMSNKPSIHKFIFAQHGEERLYRDRSFRSRQLIFIHYGFAL